MGSSYSSSWFGSSTSSTPSTLNLNSTSSNKDRMEKREEMKRELTKLIKNKNNRKGVVKNVDGNKIVSVTSKQKQRQKYGKHSSVSSSGVENGLKMNEKHVLPRVVRTIENSCDVGAKKLDKHGKRKRRITFDAHERVVSTFLVGEDFNYNNIEAKRINGTLRGNVRKIYPGGHHGPIDTKTIITINNLDFDVADIGTNTTLHNTPFGDFTIRKVGLF